MFMGFQCVNPFLMIFLLKAAAFGSAFLDTVHLRRMILKPEAGVDASSSVVFFFSSFYRDDGAKL